MSLKSLFEDRKNRKYIRDSINEAVDSGVGTCESCGEESYLIHAFNRDLCEECCNEALKIADDYDRVLESVSDDEIFRSICEADIIVNVSKLKADANSMFGGDIKKLMKSYDLTVSSTTTNWLDSHGSLYITPTDHKSGKTRINQFMIDYDGEFLSTKAANQQVPDPDGTVAPIKVKTKSSVPQSPPTPKVGSTKVPKQSSTAPSTASTSPVKNGYVSGNDEKFDIGIGDTEIKCELISTDFGAKTYSLDFDGVKQVFLVGDKEKAYSDFRSLVGRIKEELAKNPGMLFLAFQTGSSEVEINKYSVYKFVFDESSFESKITMTPVYNGKVAKSVRVPISSKALKSRAYLQTELTAWVDDRVSKKCPALVKNNKFKTSVGDAVFEIESIDDSDTITLSVDLGQYHFKGRVDSKRLVKDKDAQDAYAEILINAFKFEKLIPGFMNKPLMRSTDKYTLDFRASSKGDATVFADFDNNAFYDTGKIVFKTSIIDEFSGEEQPKTGRDYEYKKLGTPLGDFMIENGMELYDEFFASSDMKAVMKKSAQDKMKSNKKIALLRKISDDLQAKMGASVKSLKDLDIDVDMTVNNSGKVVKASVKVSDPYNDVASDGKTLFNTLGLHTKYKWLKLKKWDSSAAEVLYEVSNIDEFSEFIQLGVYEGAILDAYDIVLISEQTGRKVFHI